MITTLKIYDDGTVVDDSKGLLVGHLKQTATGMWTVHLVNKKKSPPFLTRTLAIDFMARNG